MSEDIKRYDMSGYGDGMVERPDGAFVHIDDHLSELAALLEELAKHDSVIGAGNAAKNFQDVLRLSGEVQKANDRVYEAEKRLADAERRNAELTKALTDTREALGREYWDQYAGLDETRDILDAALNKPEEAKS